jgi:hypothetical protein
MKFSATMTRGMMLICFAAFWPCNYGVYQIIARARRYHRRESVGPTQRICDDVNGGHSLATTATQKISVASSTGYRKPGNIAVSVNG